MTSLWAQERADDLMEKWYSISGVAVRDIVAEALDEAEQHGYSRGESFRKQGLVAPNTVLTRAPAERPAPDYEAAEALAVAQERRPISPSAEMLAAADDYMQGQCAWPPTQPIGVLLADFAEQQVRFKPPHTKSRTPDQPIMEMRDWKECRCPLCGRLHWKTNNDRTKTETINEPAGQDS